VGFSYGNPTAEIEVCHGEILRPISRLLWTVHLLMTALVEVSKHYRFAKSPHAVLFYDYLKQNKELLKKSGPRRCIDILRDFIKEGVWYVHILS
jgi:hypothetical protein